MKRTLGILACALLLTVIPLRAQDIVSQLSGNSSSQGFTVKNNANTSLFTVRGDGNVGIGTTTPSALLTVSGLDGFLVTGTAGSGSIPATGAGTRMMFYPNKGAFRAGEVTGTQWDDSNIGLMSSAIGYQTTASGNASTAMGFNSTASGSASTAMGGTCTASGSASTAMGSNCTASGDYSTALGNYVNTGSKSGSFVIGDHSTTSTFSAGSVNRFYGRFGNGYCLYTNSTCTVAAILYGNANSWATLSDVRKKERFLPVEGESVLERFRDLRLGTWNYKSQSAELIRHYGPMAQEWFAAFGHDGIGTIGNDTTLASADVDGVLCIAVQALEKRTVAMQEQLKEKDAEIAQLKSQLAETSQLKSQLAAQQQETDQRYAELVKMVHALQQDRQGQDQRQVMLLK
ncbi:MAG: tail fiber domain-containing protein [Bacteroidota bacterium]